MYVKGTFFLSFYSLLRSILYGNGIETAKSIFKAAVQPLSNKDPYDFIIITCQRDKDAFRRNMFCHAA